MNHITQLNNLQTRIKLYKDFMPFCPPSKVIKFCNEIIKLQNRVDVLSQKSFDELLKKVEIHYETKQSKINELNFKI